MQSKREYWVESLTKIAQPVLTCLSENRLKQEMPIESTADKADRAQFTYLEALGRTLCGLAPWLDAPDIQGEEAKLQAKFRELAQRSIANAVNPEAPDYMNFSVGHQPLVDSAFLCHAILRAPKILFEHLDFVTKRRLINALKLTRKHKPYANNWLLFSAMIETFFYFAGEADWDQMRIDYALRQHEQWYMGDGIYGDGPNFHFDYYNSFVIQPMLVDIIDKVGNLNDDWKELKSGILKRADRFCSVQERLIAPDGSFPVIGRSMAYRYGAFQHLAQMALEQRLPENVSPGQVRCALTALIRRVQVPEMFDKNGWLTVGVCGHQPAIGERYISTGSTYLCTTVFLPLGLSPNNPFWNSEDEPWTSVKVWNGENIPCEHSI